MRRMITDKQQAYVKSIGQAVQPIAMYPRFIEAETTDLHWNAIKEAIENEEIDLKNHVIKNGTYLYFNFPELLAKYGVGEGDDPGYVALTIDGDLDLPEDITNFEELKAYMCTEEFAADLAVELDEYIMDNNVISYYPDMSDAEFGIYNGLLRFSTVFEAKDGWNTPIVGATDPQYNGVKSEYIQTSIIQSPAGGLKLQALGNRSYINILNNEVMFNNISIYADTIKNKVVITNDENNFNIDIYTVSYILIGSDILQQGTSPIGIMLYGDNNITSSAATAINAAAPTELRIKTVKIGQVSNVYGIFNTKIILGKNVYVWDSADAERYVLQGTFQPVNASMKVSLVLNQPSMPVGLYNS